ncbi:MAG: phosphatidylglycerophosphatase A [Gammaproteobacteria bacterium]|nr:phosphatidylglycerophosphatase A [Gammaproteobacteria bacterium]MCH9744927.1 phosphatidylglycerophosphatase A [Gammaproteobacteria bacterium]
MSGLLGDTIEQAVQNHSRKSKRISFRKVWTNPILFIGCGFGVGTLPGMPGTYGTLLAIPFYLIFQPLPLWMYITIVAAMNVIGIWLCGIVNREFGSDDHPAAIWDEIAAFMIVLIAVPPDWILIAIGFALFRFFDIVKPGPIGWIDRNVHGGFGVMLDDIVAAAISWGILQLLMLVIPHQL